MSEPAKAISPWTQEGLDGTRSFLSSVRGPRAGKVVAKVRIEEWRPIALAPSGDVIVLAGQRVGLLDGATFEWKKALLTEEPGLVLHLLQGAGALTSTRTVSPERSTVVRRALAGGRVLAQAELEGSLLAPAASSASGSLALPYLHRSGDALEVRVRVFDRSLGTVTDALLARVRSVNDVVFGRSHVAVTALAEEPSLFLLDPASGELRARAALPTQPRGLLVDARDRVLVVTADAALTAFEVDGRVAWQRSYVGDSPAFAATPDGGCVVATEREVVRLDPDGSTLWQRTLESSRGVVVDREGFAYVNAMDRVGGLHGILALSPAGEVVFASREVASPIAIDASGRLLALHGARERGHLIAFT